MTYEEFLVEFRTAVKIQGVILLPRQIQGRNLTRYLIRFADTGQCPVTGVCKRVANLYYPPAAVFVAAKAIGLSHDLADQLTQAADDLIDPEDQTRRDLLAAANLSIRDAHLKECRYRN